MPRAVQFVETENRAEVAGQGELVFDGRRVSAGEAENIAGGRGWWLPRSVNALNAPALHT